MAITLRPVHANDEAFLLGVYAGTRQEELAQVLWTEEQRTAFLHMQFAAQDQYYREHYPDATFNIILIDGRPAGRLYVARRQAEIRIIDIALLPEYRRTGVGTTLLKDILAEAEDSRRPVTIHVERFNRALRLYERLGFQPVADQGVYLLLRWTPGSSYPNTAS